MATIKGTNNSETKYGTTSADTMYGYGGNDSLYGRAGADQLWGGTGGDKLFGEAGNDILRGEDGNDYIYGSDGNDIAYGGIGDDSLYGDAGTDTLKGEAGNDTIKGGTGISYLYGGDGNDSLYYDPSTENLAKIQNYLSGSQLNGDAGTDTLNLFNKTVYTSGSSTKSSLTYIVINEYGNGSINFTDQTGSYIDAYGTGIFKGIEKINVTGSSGLIFSGALEAYTSGSVGKEITGTSAADKFYSHDVTDVMRGGGGNDSFYFGAGNDKVISETGDADLIYIDSYDYGIKTITGFNGAGVYGGDRIFITDEYLMGPSLTISESDGKTIMDFKYADSPNYVNKYIIDKVGLEEGVDYFFV